MNRLKVARGLAQAAGQVRGIGRRLVQGARRAAEPPAATDQPLLDAAEIAVLYLQATHLVQAPRRREVHDHHAGDWPSAWLGRGLDFEESRPYSPGDDIRDMDWRTTARLGHPFVKTYREERQPVLHVVMDRGPSMRFGTRCRLKAAQAARVALLTAFVAAERNAAVSATLWDSRDLELPPRHGRAGILEFVRAMIAPCPPLPPQPVEQMLDSDRLERLAADLPRGTRLHLISDFGWLSPRHEGVLARLGERLDLLAVQVLDPAERDLPDLGLALFQGLSDGRAHWLDTGRAATRAGHAAAFAARQAHLAGLFARAGVAHRVVGSEVDDLIPLLQGHA